jgi:RNA polymerase primary sigma factor
MKALIINSSITNKTNTLSKYLCDIDKISLISVEEEVMLSEKIKAGDRAALDKLVKANLRFVVSVAKKYQYEGLTLEDLISEGNLGLIKAAERFDASRGFKFISFAVWWIRQSIMHAISEKHRAVRLPGNQLIGINTLNRAKEKLEKNLERQPSLEELAQFMELSEARVADYESLSGFTVSLNKEFNNETQGTLLDVLEDESDLPPDYAIQNQSLSVELTRLIRRLPEREQKIIIWFYGLNGELGLDLEEIATRLGLSKERVRQLRYIAVNFLKRSAHASLIAYL